MQHTGCMHRFQSTLPVRGATLEHLAHFIPGFISIHAPRAGSDTALATPFDRLVHFNPRSPCGERHTARTSIFNAVTISIHAPRAGSDASSTGGSYSNNISIHAPRAGSDPFLGCRNALHKSISIHAPRAGSDQSRLAGMALSHPFQSTLPVRGATLYHRTDMWKHPFQSTLPVRGATFVVGAGEFDAEISIHAPRAGSDDFLDPLPRYPSYFNPRSPCGERQPADAAVRPWGIHFNPRSPCGERRTGHAGQDVRTDISIHAPRAGSDAVDDAFNKISGTFQSTLPVRGATTESACALCAGYISIHAPRAGSDRFARVLFNPS